MKQIQVFDPDCSNAASCHLDIENALANFDADIDWLKQNGGMIERFNLASQPKAFEENSTVKDFLARSGQAALPLILVDGEIALTGRYPLRNELAYWSGITAARHAEGNCCGGCS